MPPSPVRLFAAGVASRLRTRRPNTGRACKDATARTEASPACDAIGSSSVGGVGTMASTAAFAEVAAMAGDPARAAMLHALMDGRALTASELARVAGITPQTASGHLARMVAVGLLSVEKQGRHRYNRLASPTVAQMIESIMRVASGAAPTRVRLAVG